jgi:hypothetical protein
VVRETSDAVEVIKRELARLREREEHEPLGPSEKPPHY